MIQGESDQDAHKKPATESARKDAAATSSTPLPSISLPKGGGAIKGIDEKFSANPVTGTGSLSVPIPTTPSRSDFYPKLSLAYDSGAGNGPFGIGWNLSVPSVTRKTDKGLPKYQDDIDSDIFLLSEAEDLVPSYVLQVNNWIRETLPPKTEQGIPYAVQRYRPRVEGLFAHIERWENQGTSEVHWRSVSKDNITSIYGRDATSRIADPDDSLRVFKWLLTESYDDKGNAILYTYKEEDQQNIDISLPQECHRLTDGVSFANRYLKYIYYGNTTPRQQGGTPLQPQQDFLFQVVFDYGEHDPKTPTVDQANLWPCRLDPFSSFRACFEIRAYRLCRRILMFHRFQELGDTPCLVRSTDFGYTENPIASYLTTITQMGYIRNAQVESYATKSLPPLEITYTEPIVDEEIHFVDPASLENLPTGLDGSRYQWVDLDSEGLSGILSEQADAWFYKRNLGHAQFAPTELVAAQPSPSHLQGGQQQIMDLAGDGQKYLVQFSAPLKGFFEHQEDGQWGPFTPFLSLPNVAWNDPNLKFIDLDGDGFNDILFSEHEVFTWYRSRARDGFEPAEIVRKPFDEEKGPTLIFADASQSIYLADMTGDGLTDIVRVYNGEICYWPNKGYGQFGFKVTMDAPPLFDYPDSFEQRCIRLADIDGSGTTDIIYLGRDTITFWFNQSGNSWSEPHQLNNFPATDNLSSITVIDLLGSGTACIVWSSPLPGDAGQPMRYVDLMGGQKPHLLQSINNHMGKTTNLQYAPSTKFYLEDKQAGTPWVTKLPFPIHVVTQVETLDEVSETRLVTQYRYHHGYYDGPEREFRGFGLVEQWDTESFEQFKSVATSSTSAQIVEEDLYVPPAYSKTWFHTGAYIDRQNISQHFAHEYYTGDPQATLLPDTSLPLGLTAQEEQEACRALKGRILRQEIYAQDGTPQSSDPYAVSEHTYLINMIQPVLDNPHGIFYAFESEAIDFHYERQPLDPRIGHSMTLEVDSFGNVTKSAAIGYPRRTPAYPEQGQPLITYTETDYINVPENADSYRIGIPCETRTYEITGVASQGNTFLVLSDLLTSILNAGEIASEVPPTPNTVQKRLVVHTRTIYYKDDLSGPLSLRQVESHALPYQSYKVALTPGLVTQVYGTRVDGSLLVGEGGYLQQDGAWWVPSGRQVYDANQFYLPVQFIDPFGNTSTVTYDVHALLVVQAADALPAPQQNIVQARNNYRTMLPAQIIDANDNHSAVLFDELGMVIATAVMGKDWLNEGDTLADPTTKLEYELFNWMNNQKPNFVHVSAREQHGAANPRWQESYSYSDGFGREVMKKIQAEPGPAPTRDAQGNLVRDAENRPVLVDTTPNVRWIGTGRTIYNNKGKLVKKYEPFFDSTNAYVTEKDLVEWGVTPILHYDPVGRVMRTDNPNGTFSKVEFDAWQQITWDENDTVLDSTWYADRLALPNTQVNAPEIRVAQLTAAQQQVSPTHVGTPGIAHLDVLGRTFLTIADNGAAGLYPTHVKLDIQGNQLVITDAQKNQAMVNDFDMLGNQLHLSSIDAGERWMLNNVVGHPLRQWNSRGFKTSFLYDVLQRPTHLFVQQGNNTEILAERTVYGEVHPDSDLSVLHPNKLNLRGKAYQHYDGSGVTTSLQYDFKGNLRSSSRQLTQKYEQQANWSALKDLTKTQDIATAANPFLETESFTATTTYDALNRPTSMTMPDSSVVRPTYNEANLLEKLDVQLHSKGAWTPFVRNFDYNAKGQRELVEYDNTQHSNTVSTAYTYDANTFRMTNLKTTRASDNTTLQDLSHTYDPVGNVTEIQDNAQQTIFFNNAKVAPGTQYVYDAIYRLTQATGREHASQSASTPPGYVPEYDYNDVLRVKLPHPNDGSAMQSYTENYAYDEVGNFLTMQHVTGGNTAWTRRYEYVPGTNRLQSTSFPGDPGSGPLPLRYTHDPDGNMTQMPHLQSMQYDFKDQLQQVDLGGGGIAYYVYDASGQRVRKVVQSGSLIKERIYLGGYEIYRERNDSGLKLERETLHVMDDRKRVALVETKTVDTQNTTNVGNPLMRDQLDNHLGSACLELDENGAIISYEEYYPYGSTSYQAGRSLAEMSLKRYRYTGKERDDETGLYYYGARYCASWLGRWINCDPKGMVDGSNLYQFTRNNPIALLDPHGTDSNTAIPDYDPEVDGKMLGVVNSSGNITPSPGVTMEEIAKAPKTPVQRSEASSQVPKAATPPPPLPVSGSSQLSNAHKDSSTGVLTLGSTVTNATWMAIKEIYAPLSPNGTPLQGPLNLYSGKEALALAESAFGHMIGDTRWYPLANAAEQALRDKLGIPTGNLPIKEYKAIWKLASYRAVRDATLGGAGVQTQNDLSSLASDSIQAETEIPTLRGFGALMGGLNIVGGTLTAASAISNETPLLLKPVAVVSGSLQGTGGLAYIIGAWGAEGSMMAAGASVAESGGVLAAPLLMGQSMKMAADNQRAIQPTVDKLFEEKNYIGAALLNMPITTY